MNKILIIEDDLEINALLADFLKEKGYAVHCQYDGLHVLDFLNKEKIDLIILDIMLPYRSGDIILSDVRKKFTIPVIIISAKETTQNKIDLLRLGADDYITKPFSLSVLRARVNTQLRKAAAMGEKEKDNEHVYRKEPYVFDFDRMKFMVDGKEIELSKTEQKLLRILVENAGMNMRRELLLDRVWSDGAEYVDENALSVSVKRLRDKLGAEHAIRTVYGIGYRWE